MFFAVAPKRMIMWYSMRDKMSKVTDQEVRNEKAGEMTRATLANKMVI